MAIRVLARGSLPVQRLEDLMAPSAYAREEMKKSPTQAGRLPLYSLTAAAITEAITASAHGVKPTDVISISEIALDRHTRCSEHGEIFLAPDKASGIVCGHSFIGHSHEGERDGGQLFATNFAFVIHPTHYTIPCVSNKVAISVPRGAELEKVARLKKYTEVPVSEWYASRQSYDLVPAQTTDAKENPLFTFISKNFSILTTPRALIPPATLKSMDPNMPEAAQGELKPAPASGPKMPSTAYHIKPDFRAKVIAYIQSQLTGPHFGRIGFDTFLCTGKNKFVPRTKVDIEAALSIVYEKQVVRK